MPDNVTVLPVVRIGREGEFDDLAKVETVLAQRDALARALKTIEEKAHSGDWTLPSSFGGCARTALDALYGSRRPQQKERRYILSGGLCVTCSQYTPGDGLLPPHDASDRCESGKRNHCTCDVCF